MQERRCLFDGAALYIDTSIHFRDLISSSLDSLCYLIRLLCLPSFLCSFFLLRSPSRSRLRSTTSLPLRRASTCAHSSSTAASRSLLIPSRITRSSRGLSLNFRKCNAHHLHLHIHSPLSRSLRTITIPNAIQRTLS